MHFGENQLSRSLIGLSPLHTGHPPGFQPWWVRASTRSYPRFTLPMRRSPRFGSTARDSNALFRLAFATATRHRLTSPRTVTRRLILQKARGHPERLPRLVSTRFQALFRLSKWSCQIHTEFHGLRATWEITRESPGFHVRDCHPLWPDFPDCSATRAIYNSLPGQQPQPGAPATPATQRLPAITRNKFGLIRFRSPLLAESLLLSLPAGTEMFHFPALPPTALCIQAGATAHDDGRVSPFGNPRIKARLPAPRGLSQAPTSFIGSWCQDIHRVLLET